MCEGFLPIFPKHVRKTLETKLPPKKRMHFICVGCISVDQSTSSTIFARISPNFPRKNYLKMWPSKTNKRCLLYDFGAIFVKSEHVQRFCEGIHTFCPHFHRFCPAFTKSKVLGVHLHPGLLHQWLAMQGKWTYTKKKMSNVTAKLAWSVFYVRKLYTLNWVEWMFVLMSMDILRRS